MATSVSFNGTSIQTNQIHIREIEHESMDHRELNIQRLGNNDGGKLVEDTFAPRVIRLRGVIISSDGTQATFETEIDAFKQLLNNKEKNLDIGYTSGTRRYKSTASRVTITRDYFNITFAQWEVEFIVSDPPFGTALDTTTVEFSAVNFTIGTFVSSATFTGTYRPMPTIRLTVNSETNLSQIAFTNLENNQQIKVSPAAGYAAADVLTINTADYTISINGTAQDYEGVIPEFIQGGNDFNVSFIGEDWNCTLALIYYPLFI